MKADRVLAIRRAVNQQRRAGHTEKAIARWLTAARLAPPQGEAWRRAGVGPSWTGPAVTAFMSATRSVRPVVRSAPGMCASPPTGPTPKLRVKGLRGDFIRTSAPVP